MAYVKALRDGMEDKKKWQRLHLIPKIGIILHVCDRDWSTTVTKRTKEIKNTHNHHKSNNNNSISKSGANLTYGTIHGIMDDAVH